MNHAARKQRDRQRQLGQGELPPGWQPFAQPLSWRDWLVAVPDAATAALFLCVWIAPTALGAGWVRTLTLTVLFEFICIHASAFLMAAAAARTRLRATVGVLVLGSGYLGIAAAFSAIFEQWWPVYAFAWLLLAKLWPVWVSRKAAAEVTHIDPTELWAASAALFIVAVIAGAIVPWPALGIGADTVAQAQVPGSGGMWVERPQSLLATGMLYFASLAALKANWRRWSL